MAGITAATLHVLVVLRAHTPASETQPQSWPTSVSDGQNGSLPLVKSDKPPATTCSGNPLKDWIMQSEQVSTLLVRANFGDEKAFESLVSLAYGELRRIAASFMRGRLNGHTLQPTALVNEAYLRLAHGATQWESKAHFLGEAARAMRQVLAGHAREKAAQKRAGDAARVTFNDLEIQAVEPDLNVARLDDALTALSRVDERLMRVMELRYFAGSSLAEIAELTGCSLATAKRDSAYARAWLNDYINR